MIRQPEHFPETVKEVRRQLALSHKELPHALGVSLATVNRWETGKTVPSKLAQATFKNSAPKWENRGNWSMARTEAQTRSELIGSLLAQSGWNLKDPTQVIEEFDILTTPPEGVSEPHTPYEGHQFSDYVLLGKDRMTQTITRIERARPAWHRIDNGRFCHNLATRFTTVSVAVTSRKVLQQIAIRIEPYQTRWDAT